MRTAAHSFCTDIILYSHDADSVNSVSLGCDPVLYLPCVNEKTVKEDIASLTIWNPVSFHPKQPNFTTLVQYSCNEALHLSPRPSWSCQAGM
jgi:hypothetical protein